MGWGQMSRTPGRVGRGPGPPAGPAFVRPPTELSSGSWSEMWTQTLSLKWEGEAPAMIGASKGLTTQPGRKVGAPDPLSSQAVRALPQTLSRQTQERGSGGCRCPPQARGEGHVTGAATARAAGGRRDLTWTGHIRRRGAQRHLSTVLAGPVAPGVWLSLAAGQAGQVRRGSTDSFLPPPSSSSSSSCQRS